MSNPLVEVMKTGQSIWYDNIRRLMLESGDLANKIADDDLRGVTSNPTIFEKAIVGSTDYNGQFKGLVAGGKSDIMELYEDLVVDDIAAADILKPVYDKTDGVDGYISLEVNPKLAYETQGTIDEAKRLFARLGRKNVMIKIPASQEGLPAIEEAIYNGININVTMIFAIENYVQVADAYIKGLERRAAEGKPVDHIGSVASFFVSRVDTAIDADLEKRAMHADNAEDKAMYEGLRGQAAIANAKIAYAKFKEIFYGERFAALKAKGAMVQRCLWASTGTKNPAYSDVLYMDNLIGPDTVNTVPPQTYTAFRDHGKVGLTLAAGVDEAHALVARLGEVGISLDEVTDKLQKDGLSSFVGSFDTLIESIEAKRDAITSGLDKDLQASLGKYGDAVNNRLKDAQKGETMRRIWRKDAALWKAEDAHQKTIKNALGWLTVVDELIGAENELLDFAGEIRDSGAFDHIMLCGMGGSSLCPEVLRVTFGKQEGYPELLVLDSTDPDALKQFADQIDPKRTLFVISSKSGTTTEPLVFYKYWYDVVGKLQDNAGENFVAVTDPGTLMEQMATDDKFRRIFLNPADIGGRYSALSYFGMVPAALMGLDVALLLDRAERTVHACSSVVPSHENPGARLGAIMGECANAGRDKITISTDPRIASFGLWVEQLIAESTGKESTGIVPIAGETLGAPSVYGADRLFVHLAVDKVDSEADMKLSALEAEGHPVVRLILNDLYDVGEEFFLWEIATAFAGHCIGINPFDQPNVQESKDATKELLDTYTNEGALPEQGVLATDGTLTLYADDATRAALSGDSTAAAVKGHLARITAGDYVAMLDYIEETPEHESLIQQIRTHIRDATRCATTTGYGPRFLHSTGQLHKGGSAAGVFLQLTAPDMVDFPIPNQTYTYSVLKQAQALGDFRSLASRGRRAIRVDLGPDVAAGLRRLLSLVQDALPLAVSA